MNRKSWSKMHFCFGTKGFMFYSEVLFRKNFVNKSRVRTSNIWFIIIFRIWEALEFNIIPNLNFIEWMKNIWKLIAAKINRRNFEMEQNTTTESYLEEITFIYTPKTSISDWWREVRERSLNDRVFPVISECTSDSLHTGETQALFRDFVKFSNFRKLFSWPW